MGAFRENSRVCFMGDSITHNNDAVSHISAFYNKNFKNVSVFNCGVAGGSIGTLLSILDEDVLVHNPTHAVIMAGINDSCRDFLGEPRSKERYDKLVGAFESYKANLEKLCDILEKNNIEIILCTQTPYDEYQDSEVTAYSGGFALMAGYAVFVSLPNQEDTDFAIITAISHGKFRKKSCMNLTAFIRMKTDSITWQSVFWNFRGWSLARNNHFRNI